MGSGRGLRNVSFSPARRADGVRMGSDGVFEMLVFNRLGGRTVRTGCGRGFRNVSVPSARRADGVRTECGRGFFRNISFQSAWRADGVRTGCGGVLKSQFSIGVKRNWRRDDQVRYSFTRPRPAPALPEPQPSPSAWLRLCCLVFSSFQFHSGI